MDYNEQNEFEQFEEDVTPQPEPEESTTAYHGAGVGQKESPFASSPYYSASEARQQPRSAPEYHYDPPKKTRKPMGKNGKRVLAALLSLSLLGGSCGITAGLINARWEREVEALESSIDALENRLEQVAAIGTGTSVSGTPVSADGLTPGQVYAMNVASVVSIGNYATVTTGGFFGPDTSSEQMVSSGSGFILTEDGYVVTNYHVVEGSERLSVTTYAGDEYDAQLIGHDEINDVALLKVEATGLNAVDVGSSDDLIVGDQVVAIGNPLGELTSTQTVGYISGKDRSVTTDGSIINMLQTDAAINSGNSGGPLFNMKGQVVGITTAKYSGSSASGASIEGIGFAIPIDDVLGMIEDLRDFGYLKNQAYLGVMVRDMDSSTAAGYNLPLGAYVTSVTEGSAAEKAGVMPQDILIAVGEYEISSRAELTVALRRFSAGDTTTITVFRSGQEIELTITFDEKPQEDTTPVETQPGEMPENGSYEEWYNYFFGDKND